jgi:hypothetical protein
LGLDPESIPQRHGARPLGNEGHLERVEVVAMASHRCNVEHLRLVEHQQGYLFHRT